MYRKGRDDIGYLLQYHSLRHLEHLLVADCLPHWPHLGASPDNISITSQLQASTHLTTTHTHTHARTHTYKLL